MVYPVHHDNRYRGKKETTHDRLRKTFPLGNCLDFRHSFPVQRKTGHLYATPVPVLHVLDNPVAPKNQGEMDRIFRVYSRDSPYHCSHRGIFHPQQI